MDHPQKEALKGRRCIHAITKQNPFWFVRALLFWVFGFAAGLEEEDWRYKEAKGLGSVVFGAAKVGADK